MNFKQTWHLGILWQHERRFLGFWGSGVGKVFFPTSINTFEVYIFSVEMMSYFEVALHLIRLAMKESIIRVAAPATLLYISSMCLMQIEALSSHAAVPSWVSARGGLPFDCTGCGDCCKVEGDVWLSPSEAADMAASLKLTSQSFDDAHCDVIEEGSGWRRLISVAPSASGLGGCTFLTTQGGCGVYETRPQQCISYPFWPRILRSPEAWDREIGACEGIGLVGDASSVTDCKKDTAENTCESTVISAVPLADIELSSLKYAAWLRRFPEDAAADTGDTAKWAKGTLFNNLPNNLLHSRLSLSIPGTLRYEHHSGTSDYTSFSSAMMNAAARLLARKNAGVDAELLMNDTSEITAPTSTKVAMVMFPDLSNYPDFQTLFSKLELEWHAPISDKLPTDSTKKEVLKHLLRTIVETSGDISRERHSNEVKVDGKFTASLGNYISIIDFHPNWKSDDGPQALLEQRSPIPLICLVLNDVTINRSMQGA